MSTEPSKPLENDKFGSLSARICRCDEASEFVWDMLDDARRCLLQANRVNVVLEEYVWTAMRGNEKRCSS